MQFIYSKYIKAKFLKIIKENKRIIDNFTYLIVVYTYFLNQISYNHIFNGLKSIYKIINKKKHYLSI